MISGFVSTSNEVDFLRFSDLLRKMSLAFSFFNKQNNHANQVTKNYAHDIMLLLTPWWTYEPTTFCP
jgi:hypothetical protein